MHLTFKKALTNIIKNKSRETAQKNPFTLHSDLINYLNYIKVMTLKQELSPTINTNVKVPTSLS